MIRSGKKRKTSIVMPAVRVNQTAATTGAVVRNFFMALGISGGNGDFGVGFHQGSAGELLESRQGPDGGGQGGLEGQGQIDLDFTHGGVLAAANGDQVATAGPADRAGDVQKEQAGNREVTGVAPAAIRDQVGQAIGATQGLPVIREAGLGLIRFRSGGALLEAGVSLQGVSPPMSARAEGAKPKSRNTDATRAKARMAKERLERRRRMERGRGGTAAGQDGSCGQ